MLKQNPGSYVDSNNQENTVRIKNFLKQIFIKVTGGSN